MGKENDRIIISLEINKEIKEWLSTESSNKEMSVSGLIRYIIKEYIKKNSEVESNVED